MFVNLNNLYQIKEEFEELQYNDKALYEHLQHVVSLTRQLQIPYKYLGDLLVTGEEGTVNPPFIRDSVLQLYQREVKSLRERKDIEKLLSILRQLDRISYSQVFLLVMGAKPEFIRVNTIIK
ncbi:hypothetical protein [Oceanobacillus timonensis]|uniref:hypothetical protein n=1 Tax=Oceanobacillus timonensis TaxID=1926285 RepID=UPI0009B9FB52|nr:hypothetical protein [Oceanobacillus timonensis]